MSTTAGNGFLPHGKRPAKPRPSVKIVDVADEDDASDVSGATTQVIIVDDADDAEMLRGHLPGASIVTFDMLSSSNDVEVDALIEYRNVLILVPGDAGPALLARAGDARARLVDIADETLAVSWPAWTAGSPLETPATIDTPGTLLAWLRGLPGVELPPGVEAPTIEAPAEPRSNGKPAVETPPADRWPPGLLVMATDREPANFGFVTRDYGVKAAVEFTSPTTGYKTTVELPKGVLVPQGVIPKAGPQTTGDGSQSASPTFTFDLIDSKAFFSQVYEVDWLIDDVQVAGEAGIFGGPQKSLKTSILIDQAISLGTATPFLGRFDVRRRVRAALISGESGRRIIQANARQVCLARGIADPSEADVLWGFALPNLTSSEHLEVLRKTIGDNGIEWIAIDPFYLTIMAGSAGIDPTSMFQMGKLLNDVAQVCLESKCTPQIAHHFVKSREDGPFAPPKMTDLAYAGIGQFMRQWQLVAPRQAFDAEIGKFFLHFQYGGSAGHCGEFSVDIEVGKLTRDFDGRKWVVTITSPSQDRAAREEQEREKREARELVKITLADQRAEQTLLANVGKVVEAIRAITATTKPATASAIAAAAAISNEKAKIALARAEMDGRIEMYGAKVANRTSQREVDAYRMVVREGRGK